MDRKDFLAIFWKKYLKFILLLLLLVFIILNFKTIIEVSKSFGILLIVIICIFSVAGICRFFIDEMTSLLPNNIKFFIKRITNFVEKFKFIFPITLIFIVILNWKNKTIVENLFLSLMTLYSIYDLYFRKNSK